MIIAVDFDGTVVTHDYPAVGQSNPGAATVLTALVERGDQLILYTMRSGAPLEDAVKWFEANGIPLWGVNANPDQHKWTQSPKVYAQLYIDDAALGVPLRVDLHHRPAVDWRSVAAVLGVEL